MKNFDNRLLPKYLCIQYLFHESIKIYEAILPILILNNYKNKEKNTIHSHSFKCRIEQSRYLVE